VRLINKRAKVFEKHMPTAFNNLAVAQHRDMLRYTKTRSGTFGAKVAAVHSRELCVLEAAEGGFFGPEGRSISFESQVGPGSGGRLVLEGHDKKTVKDHVENCAPCHIPIINIWQNSRLAREDIDHSCHVCHLTTGGSIMLLSCDSCDDGWHRACLDLPLLATPVGDCFCPRCSQSVQDLAESAFVGS
jgi:hypothetical protein